MSATEPTPRVIPDRLESRLAIAAEKLGERCSSSWRSLIFVVNSFASPYFLDPWNLSDATFNFTEKAMIALAMALLIIAGEIDLSVAAIIALASTAMGLALQFGAGTPDAGADRPRHRARSAARSTACWSPALGSAVDRRHHRHDEPVSRHRLSSSSATRPSPAIPPTSPFSARAMSGGCSPSSSRSLLVFALVFGVLLHLTSFGRMVYAIGNNPTAALFSGIRVGRVKFILFLLTGLMSGVAAICLTSRLGSTRPSIALGWELEVITMVVLGGVSILGGSGTHPRRRARRLDHGHGDLRLRPLERAGHRHVDLHRPAADRGHRRCRSCGARLRGERFA